MHIVVFLSYIAKNTNKHCFSSRRSHAVLSFALIFIFLTGFSKAEEEKVACERYRSLSISQRLACIALLNGAEPCDDCGVSDRQICPAKIQIKGPIGFEAGTKYSSGSQTAARQLGCLLKLGSGKDLDITLVGHTDFEKGTLKQNLDVSLGRARKVRDTLRSQGVSSARVKIEGRADCEPFDTDLEQKQKSTCLLVEENPAPSHGYGKDRRVEIEVTTPLLTIFGKLAKYRAESRLFDRSEVSPQAVVRHVTHHFNPGRSLALNLSQMGIEFVPKWTIGKCFGAASEFIERDPKVHPAKLIDEGGGFFGSRLRLIPRRTDSISALVLLDIVASNEEGRGEPGPIVQPRLPDHWPTRIRIEDHLVDHFKSLTMKLGKIPGMTETDALACLGLDPQDPQLENENRVLIEKLSKAVSQSIPETGDDRLSRIYGVNAWTGTFDLSNNMELCIESKGGWTITNGSVKTPGRFDGVDQLRCFRVALKSSTQDRRLLNPDLRIVFPNRTDLSSCGARQYPKMNNLRAIACLVGNSHAVRIAIPNKHTTAVGNDVKTTQQFEVFRASNASTLDDTFKEIELLPHVLVIKQKCDLLTKSPGHYLMPEPAESISCARFGQSARLDIETNPDEISTVFDDLYVNLVLRDNDGGELLVPLGTSWSDLAGIKASSQFDRSSAGIADDTIVDNDPEVYSLIIKSWPAGTGNFRTGVEDTDHRVSLP